MIAVLVPRILIVFVLIVLSAFAEYKVKILFGIDDVPDILKSVLFHFALVIIILSTKFGNTTVVVWGLSELQIVSYLAKIVNVYKLLGIKLVMINGFRVVSTEETKLVPE